MLRAHSCLLGIALLWSQSAMAADVAMETVDAGCGAKTEIQAHQRAENLDSNIKTLLETKACAECYLVGADLSKADLQDADLLDANLSKANLSGANLQNALLSNANFSEANLSNAQLQNSLIKDANLHQANIEGANFGELSEAEITALQAAPVAAPQSACRGVRG